MPGGGRSLIGLTIVALAAGAACTSLPGNTGEPPQQQRDTDASGMTYADDALCAECHRAAADAWSGSHHDLAMQAATPETVLGNFDDTTFTHFGVTSRFFQKDGRFFVNTEGPD